MSRIGTRIGRRMSRDGEGGGGRFGYVSDRQVLVGSIWHPELWQEEEWPRDLGRMRELGFGLVRLFEFAWQRFEPREGEFDFGWALRVLDLCGAHGIKVMLATPTAAPPAWLCQAHPEVLCQDAAGSPLEQWPGCRCNPHSETYGFYCERIVARMVAALAEHPVVHSWQIDNEMGGFDRGAESCALFRSRLEAEYGTIAALNKAWGLTLRGQAYSSFGQIRLPAAPGRTARRRAVLRPALWMAAARFQNDGWRLFMDRQCAVIRSGSFKPITVNRTGNLEMHWARLNRKLDSVGSVLGCDGPNLCRNVAVLDRMRAEKGRPYWFLASVSGGSGGGAKEGAGRDADRMRLVTWLGVLMGGSLVMWRQWRQQWAGQDPLNGAVVTAGGAMASCSERLGRLAGDLTRHSDWLMRHPPAQAETALLWSDVAAWALSLDSLGDTRGYEQRWQEDCHGPLAGAHVWRDVIDEGADFAKYKVILAPYLLILSEDARLRLSAWVRRGGCLLLGPLTGMRTERMTAWDGGKLGGLEELLGAENIANPVSSGTGVRFADGISSGTRGLCSGLRPLSAEPLAFYEGGRAATQAAVVQNRVERGLVIGCGCQLEPVAWLRLVKRLMEHAGIVPLAWGAAEVQVVPRVDEQGELAGLGVLNLCGKAKELEVFAEGKDLLSGLPCSRNVRIAPYGVMLISTRGEFA